MLYQATASGGVEGKRAVVGVERFGGALQVVEGAALVVPGDGEVGVKGEGAVVGVERLGVALEVVEGAPLLFQEAEDVASRASAAFECR